MLSLNQDQKNAINAINRYLPKCTAKKNYDKFDLDNEPAIRVHTDHLSVPSQVDELSHESSIDPLDNRDETFIDINDYLDNTPPLEEQLLFSHLPKEPPSSHNFLLLGPGGSGKTTVITNAIDTSKLRIAFCAFTNKATQVLKNISTKSGIAFVADFLTIHKLLALDIRYQRKETEIAFDFTKEKVDKLKMYDAIIFDECSTISDDLYRYIQEAWEYIYFKYGHSIKFIFLGDYWQLSPVGEDTSVVFSHASKEKWQVSKLSSVMRSGNDKMQSINQRLLKWVGVFKNRTKKPLDSFIRKYPNNLVMRKEHPDVYISHLDQFLQTYLDVWKSDPDVVILTQTRNNCQKTNFAIQDLVDDESNRVIPEDRKNIKFHVGDRCCIDRPIEVCSIKRQRSQGVSYVVLDEHTSHSLYNGEIFDIIHVEDSKVCTPLNRLKYIDSYFDSQILTVKRIGISNTTTYDIIHIDESIVNAARKKINNRGRRMFYLQLLSSFIKVYPKLDYGYCLTIYKSQGSEWRNVLINLSSVKYCIIGSESNADLKKKRSLFRTTYTAMSRASFNMWLFWIN
jgi:hypothetical protein